MKYAKVIGFACALAFSAFAGNVTVLDRVCLKDAFGIDACRKAGYNRGHAYENSDVWAPRRCLCGDGGNHCRDKRDRAVVRA